MVFLPAAAWLKKTSTVGQGPAGNVTSDLIPRRLGCEILDALLNSELEQLDFVFEVQLGLNGKFQSGKLLGRYLQFAADVMRAVALREKRKDFDLAIVENVERRPGRSLISQDLVELCPCHE